MFLSVSILCSELFSLSLNTDKVYKAVSFSKHNNKIKTSNKKVFNNQENKINSKSKDSIFKKRIISIKRNKE